MKKKFSFILSILTILVVSNFFKESLPKQKNVSSSSIQRNISSFSKYKRSDWKHWINRNRSCFNLRHELLKDRSLSSAGTGKKKNFCYVSSGEWDDYYFSEKLYRPKDIDIDHIIPLKHAHDIGGSLWSPEMKEKFANDPENLVITNKRYNRQKKAKTIAQWLPMNIKYACKYYKDWMHIKLKYDLPISEQEKNAVDPKLCKYIITK